MALNYTQITDNIENELGDNSLESPNLTSSINLIPEGGFNPFKVAPYKGSLIDRARAAMDFKEGYKELEDLLELTDIIQDPKEKEKALQVLLAKQEGLMENTWGKKDPNTGEYLYKDVIQQMHNNSVQQQNRKMEDNFPKMAEANVELQRFFKDKDKEDSYSKYAGLKLKIKNFFVNDKKFYSDQEFETDWTDNETKEYLTRYYLFNRYSSTKMFDENADNYNALSNNEIDEMLASLYHNNPLYESETSKRKKDLKAPELSDLESSTTELAKNKLFRKTDSVLDTTIKYGTAPVWGATWLLGLLGETAYSIFSTAGEAGAEFFAKTIGDDNSEDIDKNIKSLSDSYLNKQVDPLVLQWKQREEFYDAVQKWNKLSETSEIYRLEKGSYLTEMTDEEKAANYAKYLLSQDLTLKGADTYIENVYKNMAASRLSATDGVKRTAGQFFNSIVADMTSFLALITPLAVTMENGDFKFLPIFTEGYSDALVKSDMMQWAQGLLETGCWTKKGLEKYRLVGLNKFELYKTDEEANSYLNMKVFGDLVGQYGFTAASTALSLGGTALFSGMAKSALTTSLTSKLAHGIVKSYNWANRTGNKRFLRNTLKHALNEKRFYMPKGISQLSGADLAARMTALNIKNVNAFLVPASLGTAEGALEATSTYNTFVRDNTDALFGEQGYFNTRNEELRTMPYDQLMQKVVENGEGSMISSENLLQYLKDTNQTPSRGYKTINGVPYPRYSLKDFDKAKRHILDNYRMTLLDQNKEAQQYMAARIEDDALDAACANFISNSFINGALNATLKKTFLDRSTKLVINAYKGGKALKDLIKIVKNPDGTFKAVKKSLLESYTPSSNTWVKAFQNIKRGSASAINNFIVPSVTNALGEGLEEYSLGISDNLARDAFQSDVKKYLNVVFDLETRDAFQTDWSDIILTGMEGVGSQLRSADNFKEAMFGFLSALIGGFSPVGFVRGVSQGIKTISRGNKTSMSTYLRALSKLGQSYEGAFINNLRELLEELDTSEAVADQINTIFADLERIETLTHLGGALGFEKMYNESIMAGDMLAAKDSKLGMLIENILLLLSLSGTELTKHYEDLYNSILSIDLSEFSSTGKYEGTDSTITSLINRYRNEDKNVLAVDNLSDKEIVEAAIDNVNKFNILKERVIQARNKLASIFNIYNTEGSPALDPLVVNSIIFSMLQQEDTKERYQSLYDTYISSGAISVQGGSSMSKLLGHLLAQYKNIQGIKQHLQLLKEERVSILEGKTKVHNKNQVLRRYIRGINTVETAILEYENLLESNEETALLELDIASLSIEDSGVLLQRYLKGEFIINLAQQQFIENYLQLIIANLLKGVQVLDLDFTMDNNSIAKDLVDMAALKSRASAYDRFLADYIRNPFGLSERVSILRKHERERMFKQVYKEFFKIKPNETIYDLDKRFNEKLTELKNKVEYLRQEDASYEKLATAEDDVEIFTKLAKQQPDLVRYQKAAALLLQSGLTYITKHPDLTEEEKSLVKFALAVGQAVLVINKCDYTQLDNIIFRADAVDYLLRILKKESLDGERIIDILARKLELGGSLNLDNSLLLTDLVTVLRKILNDLQLSTLTVPGNPQPNITPNQSAPQLAPLPTLSLQLRVKFEDIMASEPLTFNLITTGELVNNDEGQHLLKFLTEYHANSVIPSIAPNDTFYIVLLKINGAVQFIVATNAINNINDGRVLIDSSGNKYTPVGFLLEDSATLDRFKTEHFDEITDTVCLPIAINQLKILIKVQQTQDAVIISKESKSGLSTRLTSLLDIPNNIANRMELILEFCKEVYDKGVIKTKQRSRDSRDITREFTVPSKAITIETKDSFFDLVMDNGSTVAELFDRMEGIQDEDQEAFISSLIIPVVQSNALFKQLFSNWKYIINSTIDINEPYAPVNVFNMLLGNFIYLGNVPVTLSTGSTPLTFTLNIFSESNKNTPLIKISLPFGDQQVNMSIKAIQTLYTIYKNLSKFPHLNPLISFAPIEHKELSQNVKSIFINILAGIMQGKGLYTLKVDGIQKTVRLQNPFHMGLAAPVIPPQFSLGMNFPPASLAAPSLNDLSFSVEEASKDFLNNVENKLKNYLRILLKDDSIKDPNETDKNYYEINGEQHSRVTSVEKALILDDGDKATPFPKALSNEFILKGEVSTRIGTTFDALLRLFIVTTNALVEKGMQVNLENIKKGIMLNPLFNDNGKLTVPNINKALVSIIIDPLLEHFIVVLSAITAKGWKIIPNDIVVHGVKQVSKEENAYGTLNVAGTLDLLAYDPVKDEFHVIDIKTIHKTGSDELDLIDLRINNWLALVTGSYVYLAKLMGLNADETTDIKFGQNYVFPLFLDYSFPMLISYLENDRYNSGTEVRSVALKSEFMNKMEQNNPSETIELEDFLVPLKQLPDRGYNYSQLDEEDLNRVRVIPLQQAPSIHILSIQQPIEETSTSSNEAPSSTQATREALLLEASKKPIYDPFSQEDDEEYSEVRTESSYMSFMNSRIAPITRFKLSFIEGIKSIIKKYTLKEQLNILIENDLATTFFNGDVEKLRLLVGKNVKNNLEENIKKIRRYIQSISAARNSTASALRTRFKVLQLLHDFLTNQISEEDFNKSLLLYENTSDIPELVEYMMAEDKNQITLELLNRLEETKEYTEEVFNALYKELTLAFTLADNALRFLSTTDAIMRLQERINSIETSFFKGNFDEVNVKTHTSIQEMLNKKGKHFSCIPILLDIIHNNNDYHSYLALIILKELKAEGNKILLEIANTDDLLEGSYNNNKIVIQETALDNRAHLERVILHELLHAITRKNLEIKLTLLPIYEEALSLYAAINDMLISDVKQLIYGFKNINEFISEFYSNYAFLAQLKQYLDIETKYNSLFDKILLSIKKILLNKRSTLFNKIDTSLSLIFSSLNIFENKLIEVEFETDYDRLSEDIKNFLELKHLSKYTYNLMSLLEREHLLRCCR